MVHAWTSSHTLYPIRLHWRRQQAIQHAIGAFEIQSLKRVTPRQFIKIEVNLFVKLCNRTMPVTGQRNPFKTVHLFRVYAIRTFRWSLSQNSLPELSTTTIKRRSSKKKSFSQNAWFRLMNFLPGHSVWTLNLALLARVDWSKHSKAFCFCHLFWSQKWLAIFFGCVR